MSKNDPFDPELVRELAKLINETDLSEIEVEKGDLRIRVVRRIERACGGIWLVLAHWPSSSR